MKTRYFFTLTLATLLAYVLAPGCTQDFDVFQPCSAEQKVCDGACVDRTDPAFGCSADACAPCALANATSACSGTQCAVGECSGAFENCDGSAANGCEANPSSDPQNCGACGNVCVTPHANPLCEDGECNAGSCEPNWENCDGMGANGCEANLLNDPQNCGACDNACSQFESCQNGQCVIDCPDGTGDCDGDPGNGCETQLNTAENCGFCGDACDLANAAATCTAGACVIQSCDAGFDDCDGMDANGCEADLQNSAMTCGACNNACPDGVNGTTVCNNGQCALNCNSGFGDCDSNVQNGCETDTSGSLTHCGACGQACSPANGAGACVAGVCEIGNCTAPFADCDSNVMNGCETNTGSSLTHCGMCNMGCSFPNAAASCNMGVCAMGACNAGFGDCDNMAATGCESPTANDPANCGMCGNACPTAPNAVAACSNGVCALACNNGFENCDGSAANGCETNIASSVTSCGACNRACAGTNVASRSCNNGVCDSTCNLGFANCTQPAAPAMDNGCELNVAASDTNCGGCANNCGQQGNPANGFECDDTQFLTQAACGCSANTECNAGAMGSCNGGLCSCNGVACKQGEACVSNGGVSTCSCGGGAGCGANETCCDAPAGCFNLRADAQNCGACGRACTAGFVCFDTGAFTAPECRCDDAADCNAGTGGTFSCNANGRCVCNGATCTQGQRCLPSGQCG
jgi:hypothetical protein